MDTHWREDLPRRSALPLSFLVLILTGIAEQGRILCQDGAISVDVNLVELYVTARDAKGNFVAGLQKEDFHVFEDGQLQNIRLFQHQDAPVSVGLIVDNSASMRRKSKDVTAAALLFVRSSNPQDEMFIVNFNERVSLGLPHEKLFTADAGLLEKALNGVPAAGMTALYDAIDLGLDHLKKASRDRKILIVISDGGDNASHDKLSEVLATLERSDVPVYAIGIADEFDADQKPGILKKIARATGGESFFPTQAGQVPSICERIAEEIRCQYTIAYVPSNQSLDNTYRKIRVVVSRPHGGKVFVRARDGYIASPGEKERTAGEFGR